MPLQRDIRGAAPRTCDKFRLAILLAAHRRRADLAAVHDRTMKSGTDDSGTAHGSDGHEAGSTYAWTRLAVALVVMRLSTTARAA